MEESLIRDWSNSMDFSSYLTLKPYMLDKEEKKQLLSRRVGDLILWHKDKCPEYKRILDMAGFTREHMQRVIEGRLSYEDVPFLPVRLFKELELRTVNADDVVKVMTSSGTTGQAVSKIYLDKETSANQQKAMVKIVSDFTGVSRLPMIIIDCPSVVKDRRMFSARGAGVLGFSVFGRDKIYALKDEDMGLDVDALNTFLQKHKDEKILLFGFTFMIWKFFYAELIKQKEVGRSFDLSHAILIHGGGWKKLLGEAVSPLDFKSSLEEVCGITQVHDYYGMAEQMGCIYMECEYGHLHASIFSDIIVRNPKDFSVCEINESGIIEVVSSIPQSYPGHCLLTEDLGIVLGEDDCPCGRKGKYFQIEGRLEHAEIRGCSDTYEISAR